MKIISESDARVAAERGEEAYFIKPAVNFFEGQLAYFLSVFRQVNVDFYILYYHFSEPERLT